MLFCSIAVVGGCREFNQEQINLDSIPAYSLVHYYYGMSACAETYEGKVNINYFIFCHVKVGGSN